MKKFLLTLFIILILAAGAYWYFFMRVALDDTTGPETPQTGFVPINRPGGLTGEGQGTAPGQTNNEQGTSTVQVPGTQLKIPTLRLLSDTPVSGYGASTTGKLKAPAASSTTAIRWTDRGRGNVYEALGNTLDITTLSNTVVPKLYESLWNKNLTGFIAFGLSDDDSGNDSLNGVYAELRSRNIPQIKTATSTGTASTSTVSTPQNTQPVIQYNGSSLTPYELKGKSLPEDIITYAVSPKKDRVFLIIKENGSGIGYTMNFDGSKATKIFTTPMTQINADWPSENVIAITTKGAADSGGFLYFVDPKTGIWKKILGPLPGLSAKVSTDAKHVFLSVAGNANNIISSIYTIQTGKGEDAVVRTLADKCVWGNFFKEMVYCAVPSQPIAGTYPDDWYIGNVSFVDKIWAINSLTNEITLISSIVDTSDRVIDAFNLGLDEKDDFLIFMNKDDLSLWSLDLVSKN